jgi:hypothetical protein
LKIGGRVKELFKHATLLRWHLLLIPPIVVAGGITPSDVLYNFVGTGGGVAMSGGASVAGILLVLERGIALSNSTVTGEIISGGSGIAFSGTTQLTNSGP